MTLTAASLVLLTYMLPLRPFATRRGSEADDNLPSSLNSNNVALTMIGYNEDVQHYERKVRNMTSGKRPAGLGQECLGSKRSRRGNCGSLSLPGVDGIWQVVPLYCYDLLQTETPGTKASSGNVGVCQVPRKKPCVQDDQCRRGTFCQPSEDTGYTCQEISQAYLRDNLKLNETAHVVSAMLVHVVDNYLAALDTAAFTHATVGIIGDPRTGAVSPYGSNPQLAKVALRDLSTSFQQVTDATLAGKNSASKSGASFILSGDGRFMLKSIREAEYTALTAHIVEQLATAGNFASLSCTADEEPWCWAAHTMSSTLLVVPLLAFCNPKQKEYWVAMPAVAQLRGLVISRNVAHLPWGDVHYLDVKPLPAKSNARPELLKAMQKRAFLPMDESTPPEQQRQWINLERSLLRDIELLSVKTPGQPLLVDYSLLFELYKPPMKVTDPGHGCLSSAECFEDHALTCWIVCVSIIDYFVTFGPMRKLESFFKGGKFNAYGTKAIDMLSCIFGQYLPSGTQVSEVQGGSGDTIFLLFQRLTWVFGQQEVCEEYMEIACGDLKISGGGYNENSVWYVAHDFGDRLRFCGSYWASRTIGSVKEEPREVHVSSEKSLSPSYFHRLQGLSKVSLPPWWPAVHRLARRPQ